MSQQGSLGWEHCCCSEDSARSSLPSNLTKAASREALGAKCFLWLFFKSLEWTQPILSYYFRMKSAVSLDQVLEKPKVWQPSSKCEQTAINTAVIIIIYCPQASSTAGGRNRLALVLRNLLLRFSHSKTKASMCITPPSPPSQSL